MRRQARESDEKKGNASFPQPRTNETENESRSGATVMKF